MMPIGPAPKPLARITAILLTAAMTFASSGIHHVWFLAWLAPVPLLLLLPDLTRGCAVMVPLLSSVIGALSFVLAYRGALPVVALIAMPLLFAVPFVLVALAWRAIARRTPAVVAVVAYPALVTFMEHLVSLVSPHGTFGSIAYSQGDLPVVLQIASITGPGGITFLLSLVAAAVAVGWRCRHEGRTVIAVAALVVLFLAGSLGFGAVRLAAPPPENTVRVGLVASDADLGRHFAAHDREVALQVVEAYAARAATLAKDGAQVVVLPEKFVGLTPEYADTAHAILATVAREHGVTIVAGFNLLDPTERRNVAIAFSPAGDEALVYDKEHLVPGLEARYRRGGTIGLLPGTAPITGVAICKDLDFLPLGRAYSRAGAGLLLVPAWDFIKDAWLHSRMAVLRGVEGGFAVARCADEGRLTVSDARGRILGERSTREAPEVFLAASVPTGAGRTIYSRTGDWFAWLCGTIVAACSVAAMRNRRRVVGPGA